MGTEKRERQKANRDARRAEQLAAEARSRRIRFIRNAVILTIVIIVVGYLLAGCGSSDSDGTSTTDRSADATDASTTAPADGDGDTTTAPAEPAEYGTGECAPAEGTSEPVLDFTAAPAECIDPAKTYTAEIVTTEGTVTVLLDTTKTPVTSNNFVNLARSGYYDGTDLFRTEAASGIIQGGSPHTQDNADPGPGYTIPDEALPFTSDDYGPGTLAMARTAAPNSASAQFFLLANEGGRYLGDPASVGESAGSYAVFGTVTEGLDVLLAISQLDDGAGAPSKAVSIESVTVTES